MTARCDKCGKKTKHLIRLEGEASQMVFGSRHVKHICPLCFKRAEHIANIMGGNSLEEQEEEKQDLKTMLEEMKKKQKTNNQKRGKEKNCKTQKNK